jgi:ATP-dependent DNA helicase RecQ
VIFSDKTLKAIAKSVPQSLDQLKNIEWIGAKKLSDYGNLILEQVVWFGERSSVKKKKVKKKTTYEETWELYQQGLGYEEIALQRWVGESTIITHLTKLYQGGKTVSFEGIIDDETIKKVQQAKAELGDQDTLKPYYEYFGGAVSYDEIRVGLVLENKSSWN